MKIIFYIRTLFKDSEMKKCDSVNVFRGTKNFDTFSKISLIEYRNRIHQIQIECLKDISPYIISNNKETGRGTFCHIQPSTLEKLMSLDDDDILIPLDDDDWLSPEIKKIDFTKNHMTIWNSFTMNPNGKIFYPQRQKSLPMRPLLESESEYLLARSLLSNCGAYKVGLLKKLSPNDMRIALQLHTQPRIIIRKKEYLSEFTENILDDYFAVYVRHAGNVTGGISIMDCDNPTRELFDSVVGPRQKIVIDPTTNFGWSQKYFDMLYELNNQL